MKFPSEITKRFLSEAKKNISSLYLLTIIINTNILSKVDKILIMQIFIKYLIKVKRILWFVNYNFEFILNLTK